jgi:hypothetical protein
MGFTSVTHEGVPTKDNAITVVVLALEMLLSGNNFCRDENIENFG